MNNLTLHSLTLVTSLPLFVACDEPSVALDDRAAREHAELQAEVNQMKEDVPAAESRVEAQAAELEPQVAHMKDDAKSAANQMASDGKNALHETGESVKKTIDKADKAVAEKIRHDT